MKVTILIKAINKNKPFCLTCGSPLILYVQDMMPHMSLCCLEGNTAKDGFIFYHGLNGLNGLNEVVLWRKEEIKKFVAFPGLTPLQPDVYAQPSKRASLSDIPIRLVCPLADRKAPKQNSCPWQYKMSLQRRLLTVTSSVAGACPMAYCPPGRDISLSYIRGRCPRLLMVVPSRHRSA